LTANRERETCETDDHQQPNQSRQLLLLVVPTASPKTAKFHSKGFIVVLYAHGKSSKILHVFVLFEKKYIFIIIKKVVVAGAAITCSCTLLHLKTIVML